MSDTINITVNGNKDFVNPNMSVYEYVRQKNFDEQSLVVEYNYQLITKLEWEAVKLHEGDIILIFKFIENG